MALHLNSEYMDPPPPLPPFSLRYPFRLCLPFPLFLSSFPLLFNWTSVFLFVFQGGQLIISVLGIQPPFQDVLKGVSILIPT